MAHINSIAIGKGSGKLGNIVFQSYNGKTYARQKNETISKAPTDAQLRQQNKMFNCARAGSFVLDFFRNYKASNQNGLSFSAYWAKLTSQDFTNFRALRGFQSVRQLAGKSFGNPYLIQITELEVFNSLAGVQYARIHFSPQLEQWEDNLQMYVMCTNIDNTNPFFPISSMVVRDQTVSVQDYENKYIDIEIEDFNIQFIIAYARQAYTYSCNFAFSNLAP